MSELFYIAHVRTGFKGDGDDNLVLPASDQCIFADPYPREEQANFAKWYVISF